MNPLPHPSVEDLIALSFALFVLGRQLLIGLYPELIVVSISALIRLISPSFMPMFIY
jgi:hypothetical protein